MSLKIFIITDYKNRFETKYTAVPYRSGMDKQLLIGYFKDAGYEAVFIRFHEIDFRDPAIKDRTYIYCSSEDERGYYKSYIEDIVLGLAIAGAKVVPDFRFLKAHHNKVFMEILRDLTDEPDIKNLRSLYFGTLEEYLQGESNLEERPYVTKPASSAMSRGVKLAAVKKHLPAMIRKNARSYKLYSGLKDLARSFFHQGYMRESKYRKKVIVQDFIPGLTGDWKVLVYGDKYYALKRENRKNDFRASGSGKLNYTSELPEGLLDFANAVFDLFKVPFISLDLGSKENEFFLLEFQALYFGTYTIEHSDFYFIKNDEKWELVKEMSVVEEEYVKSIVKHLKLSK